MNKFFGGSGVIKKCGVMATALLCLGGCVVEPYPPPAPVAMAPGYYAQPCCYSYYEYPPAYYYGPNIGLGLNFGGGGGHGWGYGGGRRWR